MARRDMGSRTKTNSEMQDRTTTDVIGKAAGRDWVAPSRTNGSRPYQRTSWRMNHEPPDFHLSKSDRTAARTDSKGMTMALNDRYSAWALCGRIVL